MLFMTEIKFLGICDTALFNAFYPIAERLALTGNNDPIPSACQQQNYSIFVYMNCPMGYSFCYAQIHKCVIYTVLGIQF